MSEIFEGIGEALEPLSGAIDWLAPDPGPTGRGASLGSLMGSIGQGVTDVVREGPGAILGGAYSALNPSSGMSARERLMIGGLVGLGGGMMAREAHQTWKASLNPDVVMRNAPSGRDHLAALGESDRFTLSELGERASEAYPGLNPRMLETLGAVDYDGVLRGVRRWADDDEASQVWGRQLFERYALQVGGAEAAQVDWARFDAIVERKILSGDDKANASVRKYWRTLTTAPGDLTPGQAEELFGHVRAVSQSTQAAGHDMSFGVVGRIERIDLTDNGPVIYTRQPAGWKDGSANDAAARTERLRQLNYRQLTERGMFMLRSLYERGMNDWNRPEGARRSLPRELEVGPEWYPTARNNVADVFGYDRADSEELSRAVAAVSFLSEAEDWSGNIVKAHRVMNEPKVTTALQDQDFLAWLKNPESYSGAKAKKFEAIFGDVHEHFRTGFKISGDDLKVVLRLTGAAESLTDIFLSTNRRKQRNFYLNIYRPDLELPVTIDRHAFDAFLGIDSGLNDRPIDFSLRDGEQVYDVIADTYRALARQLSEETGQQVLPHQVQAVVWETWRMLKADEYVNVQGKTVARRGGWANNDPYMLPEQNGSQNLVYEALNGRGFDSITEASNMLPARALEVESAGLGSAALPDGSVAYIAEVTEESSALLRHLYPAVVGADRIPRWAPVRATPVASVKEIQTVLGDTTGVGESFLNQSFEQIGGHPALIQGEIVMFDVPEGVKVPKGRGWQAVDLGRVARDEPEHVIERLSFDDMDPEVFVDPERSPLTTHQWAIISAETTPTHRPILADEVARDDTVFEGGRSQEVTPEEFQKLAEQGRKQLDEFAKNSSPISGLDNNWDELKASTFEEVQQPWGGATIDAHTGKPLPQGANKWAITVKDEGFDTVEVPENPTREQWDAAMDEAKEKFRPLLERQDHYLGVFHDDSLGRIDIDPVLVVSKRADVDTIGSASRAIGGAYNFADGNGYWPPHVSEKALKAERTAASRKLLAEMRRKGYQPARADGRYTHDNGTVVNEQSYVMFGMTPDEAVKVGKSYGQESIITNQGLVYSDGSGRFVPSEGINFSPSDGDRTVVRVGDVDVPFYMNLADAEPQPFTPQSLMNRTTRTSRRMAVKLSDRSGQKIADVASDVESKGGANLGLYTHSADVEGWQRASESVYSDGVQTYSVRSKSAPVTSPNSSTVFVRHTDGMLDEPPAANPVIDDPEAFLSSGSIVAPDENDLMPVLQHRALLMEAGQDPADLRVGRKKYSFPKAAKKTKSQTVRLKNGLALPPVRHDTGMSDEFGFMADFGFTLDPRWRSGRNDVQILDEGTIQAFRSVTEMMEAGYGDAFRRYGLSGITVSEGLPKQYAQMEWSKRGGGIILSKEWWSDMPKMMDNLALDRAEGTLARGAPVSPESILVHEYGHVIHGAIRLIEGWGKTSRFENTLRDRIKWTGSARDWRLNASDKLSTTAALDFSELVAESFSEVLLGNPSVLSSTVVELTDEYLQEALKFRRLMGW